MFCTTMVAATWHLTRKSIGLIQRQLGTVPRSMPMSLKRFASYIPHRMWVESSPGQGSTFRRTEKEMIFHISSVVLMMAPKGEAG